MIAWIWLCVKWRILNNKPLYMSHERKGESDEWYTPKYIFDALNTSFDLDAASPIDRNYCHVPARNFITEDSLNKNWVGFTWLNPPFGNMPNKFLWAEKFVKHGNGIILMPDRSSCPWWHYLADNTEVALFVKGKIKFGRADGTIGKSPSNGTTLFAIGPDGREALVNARDNKLGKLYFSL